MHIVRPTLTTISNIAFSCACLATVAVAASRYVDGRYGLVTSAAGAQSNPIPPGTQVPQLDGISFGRAEVTVAVVVQTECRFCAESMPFYRKLSGLRAGGRIQLVVLSQEAVTATESYLHQRELEVDRVGQLKGADLPVVGTPTLLLIDKTGTVERSWLGRLTATQEKEVTEHIASRSVLPAG
jgi:hypothetical protein